tara:strand:+ start:140 stop:613 length:474 start_codon:yes stop_codon:yes gene_type:complete
MENKINDTDFETLSLETLKIDKKSIIKDLPVSSNDERLLLYQNHELAKTLLSSTDNNLKYFFKNTMRLIFNRYLNEMTLDNSKGHYNDILKNMTTQQQVSFNIKMRDIKNLLNDYVHKSNIYSIEFALNKVIEITKYFIEFINPMYTIQLDLELLQL